MTVKEIVSTWLKEHGYDGLTTGCCWCSGDNLMVCNNQLDDCRPAYRHICNRCKAKNRCGARNDVCYKQVKREGTV